MQRRTTGAQPRLHERPDIKMATETGRKKLNCQRFRGHAMLNVKSERTSGSCRMVQKSGVSVRSSFIAVVNATVAVLQSVCET